MSLNQTQVMQIANLAKLHLEQKEIPAVTEQLNNILNLLGKLQKINTDDIAPLTNPLEATQRLRLDVAQNHKQRDYYQSLTPHIARGLYLVPQVI